MSGPYSRDHLIWQLILILEIFLFEKIDYKITDLHRPSLWRCSVSENDTDPMVSATNPRIYLSKLNPNLTSLDWGLLLTETNRLELEEAVWVLKLLKF